MSCLIPPVTIQPDVCVKVPEVIGTGECKVLLCNDIPLNPPAYLLENIEKKVFVDDCYVDDGVVFINGHLRKNILYKVAGSTEVVDSNTLVCGALDHCTITIPFCCYAEVPGAMKGDNCEVEYNKVKGEEDVLSPDGTLVQEKALVVICVKVLREKQVTVTPQYNTCPTCPPTPINGEYWKKPYPTTKMVGSMKKFC